MNAKQLKNAILQLAIQGKLVPQDPTDEPASALLAQIRKEKEQLVKAGKLKPACRQAGKKDLETTPITDEEKPFEIPESWEWCRWGDLSFSIQYGYNASAQTSGDIRMVRISDIQNNEVLWNSVPYCKINADEIDTYLLEENDILFARTGGTVGKSFLVKKVPYPAIYAGYLIRTRYSKNLIPQYLKFFMESSIYWDQLRDGTIATAQPNCNGKTLSKMLIPLPPLAEQHRIVAKIEELMPLVEEYGAAQEKLNRLNEALPEALKKSILQQAIQGKLVPQDPSDEPASVLLPQIRKEKEQLLKAGKLKPACRQAGKKDLETTPISDEEKPFEIPKGWEWVRLGEVINLLSGQDLTPDRYFDTEKGIPYITGASHFDNGNLKISRWTETPTSVSKKGDLLITCKGTVGTMAYNNIGDIHIARQVMAISPIKIYLPYINVFLDFFVPELEKQAHSIIPGISRDILLSAVFPLPPLAEQHRIVSKIEELMGMVEEIR